jgi:hypothetical protein
VHLLLPKKPQRDYGYVPWNQIVAIPLFNRNLQQVNDDVRIRLIISTDRDTEVLLLSTLHTEMAERHVK